MPPAAVLRLSSYGDHVDACLAQRRANTSGKLRGTRRVAMDADRVDAERYSRAVNRVHRLVTHHSDHPFHDRCGIVNHRTGFLAREERAIWLVRAVGKYLARCPQARALARRDKL